MNEHTLSKSLQMEIADKFLSALESIDPDGIVAGGAARDWFTDKPAKDIDIFLHVREGLTKDKFWTMVKRCLYRHIGTREIVTAVSIANDNDVPTSLHDARLDGMKLHKAEPSEYQCNKDLLCVVNVSVGEHKNLVQIMARTTHYIDTVKSFPFNVCQAWYRGEWDGMGDNGKINAFPVFYFGIHNKVILKNPAATKYTTDYETRIRSKFPDYKFCADLDTLKRSEPDTYMALTITHGSDSYI